MPGLRCNVVLKLRSWLRLLFAPAEDPRQSYEFAFDHQRQFLVKVDHALKDISWAKNRLQAKAAECEARESHLREQARFFMEDDQEDLARLAIKEQISQLPKNRRFSNSCRSSKEMNDGLRQSSNN